MKTILRFFVSSVFLLLLVVIGNVTTSYAEDTNSNVKNKVEETTSTEQVSDDQNNSLTNDEVKNGWYYNENGEELFYKNNNPYTGWLKSNDSTNSYYYFENGVRIEDSFKTIGNDRYHFYFNGIMSTGLFSVYDGSKNTSFTYYANSDGRLLKEGFKNINNSKYYFENYVKVTSARKLINGKYYYFKADGTLLTGLGSEYVSGEPDRRILADSNGVLVNGWYEVDIGNNAKRWNYFENGYAVTEGTRTIDGSTYSFDWNGLVKGTATLKDQNTGNYSSAQTSRTGSLLTGMQLVDNEYQYYNSDHTRLENGWAKYNGSWYYFENGNMIRGSAKVINGKSYYFDDNGKMCTGWIRPYDYTWYYADASGALITNKFTTINGKKYAFNDYGDWCFDGIFKVENSYYGFDKNGQIRTGWYKDDNDSYFYLSQQGTPVTGWQKINGKWYYFNVDYHVDYPKMVTGAQMLPNSKTYLFDEDGVWVELKKTGWLNLEGYWFYIDKNLQPLVGEHKIDGHSYYFSENGDVGLGIGTMFTDEVNNIVDDKGNVLTRTYYDKNGYRLNKISAGWHLYGGEWYYYDADDKPHNGLLQYNGDTYFIKNGWMVYNTIIDADENKNISYFFDSNGKKVKSGWILPEDWGYWLYADGSNNGQLVSGWKTIDKSLYYFNEQSHFMINYGITYIEDEIYAFDKNGHLIKNTWYKDWHYHYLDNNGRVYRNKWLYFNGHWYYFDWNGNMVTGYCNIYDKKVQENKAYKFDENGILKIGWEKIDNKWYYFDNNGDFARGWKLIEGKYYYFTNFGAMTANKWIGNYYLQADGSMAKNTWIGRYHVDANGKWDKTR